VLPRQVSGLTDGLLLWHVLHRKQILPRAVHPNRPTGTVPSLATSVAPIGCQRYSSHCRSPDESRTIRTVRNRSLVPRPWAIAGENSPSHQRRHSHPGPRFHAPTREAIQLDQYSLIRRCASARLLLDDGSTGSRAMNSPEWINPGAPVTASDLRTLGRRFC